MQHSFDDVNLINRRWRITKTKRMTLKYLTTQTGLKHWCPIKTSDHIRPKKLSLYNFKHSKVAAQCLNFIIVAK